MTATTVGARDRGAALEVRGVCAGGWGEGGEEACGGGEEGGAPEEAFACAVVVGCGVGRVG